MKYFLYTFLLGILLTGTVVAHAQTGTQTSPIGTTLSVKGDAFTADNIRLETNFRTTCTAGGGVSVPTAENEYVCQATATPAAPAPSPVPAGTPPGDAATGLDAAGPGAGTAPSKITCVDTSTGGSQQIDGTTCPPGTQAATNIKPSTFTTGGGGGAPLDQTSLQNYVPLEPLPFMATYAQFNFSGFLTTLFKVLISAAGLIAVGALVIGGITYMVSEVTHRKVQALERVRSALWGLLILVASVLILNTVNPQLTSFSNILNPVSNPGSSTFIDTPNTQQAPNCATCSVQNTTGTPAVINNPNERVTGQPATAMDPAATIAAYTSVQEKTTYCTNTLSGAVFREPSGLGCPSDSSNYVIGRTQYNRCANITTPTGITSCYYNQPQ